MRCAAPKTPRHGLAEKKKFHPRTSPSRPRSHPKTVEANRLSNKLSGFFSGTRRGRRSPRVMSLNLVDRNYFSFFFWRAKRPQNRQITIARRTLRGIEDDRLIAEASEAWQLRMSPKKNASKKIIMRDGSLLESPHFSFLTRGGSRKKKCFCSREQRSPMAMRINSQSLGSGC